jgi:hypothetical protein
MPRRTTDPEAEVANLQRRATELEQKIGMALVMEAMESHAWCIPQLVSKLESLGLVEQQGSGKRVLRQTEGVQQALSAQAVARQNRKQPSLPAPSPSKHEEAAMPAEDVDPTDQVPTKYWTLDSLSPHAMATKLLCQAEPTSLSMANLKQITKKGEALMNHQKHMRLLEFVSGLPGDFGLTGVYRSWHRLADLVKQRSLHRGRRCRDVVLPVDFDDFGIYMILRDPSDCVATIVKHRFTGQQVAFKPADLPPHENIAELYIANNWSELRAAIQSKADPLHSKAVLLITFFPTQVIGDAARDSKLAIQDAGAEASVLMVSNKGDAKRIPEKRVNKSFIADLASAAKKAKQFED